MDQKYFEAAKVPLMDLKSFQAHGSGKIAWASCTRGSEQIRNVFSSFNLQEYAGALVDLGSVSISAKYQLESVMSNLFESEHHGPCIICGDDSLEALLSPNFLAEFMNPVVIHNSDIFIEHYSKKLLHEISFLGYQKHLSHRKHPHNPDKSMRLGDIRTDMQRAEVILRNADIVVIHLDAIRLGDNGGSTGSLSSGLTIEEICQLARYAGASHRLKAAIICGYDYSNDHSKIQAQNIALISWYLLEGCMIKKSESANGDELVSYTVLPDSVDAELTFYKNPRSGRWWVEIISEETNEPVRLACSQKDYEEACLNNISERIMHLLARV